MQNGDLDIIGVGYGPSNLALAIAIEEYNQNSAHRKINALYLETKELFDWHPDMMLPDSNMQIAFPKDLVTFRNPSSEYSFFSYLFNKGRLPDFVNLKTFYPSRIEFADYLRWAACKVNANVNYSNKVNKISQENEVLSVSYLNGDGEEHTVKTKNIIVGGGLKPKLPNEIKVGPRIFHNYAILQDIKKIPSFDHKKIAILGAGQSAAEVITYLYDRFPNSEIHVIFSRFGLTPSDSTPYNNRIFDPVTVDSWFRADHEVKNKLFNYHKTTNYSAVDEDLINKIYGLEYQELVTGKKRLFFSNASNITSCEEYGDKVSLTVENLLDQKTFSLDVDLLVCATGFSPFDIGNLLDQKEQYIFDNNYLPETTRDYRLKLKDGRDSSIYLNGCTEHLHGFSATLLSVTAVRVGEILNSIVKNN